MPFISDHIDTSLVDKFKFNIIASGTGTGKTYFCGKELQKRFPNVKQHEILFVTSRALTVDQQNQTDEISKYNPKNLDYIKQWNGEEDFSYLEDNGIQIMTFDKIIRILQVQNKEGLETLSKVKIIIFDECHTLFSDKFIKNIELLKVWIRDALYTGTKVIIGMTATPNILDYYQKQWGVSVNRLNNEILLAHKAKQLHCTDFKTIPYIVTTKLAGKTMIMCYSYADCKKLKEEIPNSFILISQNNSEFTSRMDMIRKYIVENESIPDTFIDDDGVEKELNVLITTSTLREGVNLREHSGIRNIVCCFSDELHITQFAGRCRYNIDNLVVADTYINSDNCSQNEYLTKCRASFRDYIKNEENIAWFDTVSHLVEHDVYGTNRFTLKSNEQRFINYINKKWLVPKGITDIEKYKIYKNEDIDEIIKMVCDCHILKLFYSKITFKKVINLMENTLGYTIDNGTTKLENRKQYSYKLVIDYDEDKSKADKERKIS